MDRLLSSEEYNDRKCAPDEKKRKRPGPSEPASLKPPEPETTAGKDLRDKKDGEDGNGGEQDKETQLLASLLGQVLPANWQPSKRAKKMLEDATTAGRLNGYVMMEAVEQDASAVLIASSSKLLKTKRLLSEVKEISSELKLPALACFADKKQKVRVRELLVEDLLKLELWQPHLLNLSFLSKGQARASVNQLPMKPAMLAMFASLLSTRAVY